MALAGGPRVAILALCQADAMSTLRRVASSRDMPDRVKAAVELAEELLLDNPFYEEP